YAARPVGSVAARGLLVMQEAFGVNAHIRDITERFAREGFLAVAPELYHRTGAGFEGRYEDFPSAMPHLRALSDPSLEADCRAAFLGCSGPAHYSGSKGRRGGWLEGRWKELCNRGIL